MRVLVRALAVCAALVALCMSPARAEPARGYLPPGAGVLAQAPIPTAPVEPEPFAPPETAPEPVEGFRYPAAFLVPLALLVLGGMLARALTRPIPSRR